METSQWLLYAVASLLALRALFGLMCQHKQEHTQRLDAEDAERRKAEKKALAAQQPPPPAANGNGSQRGKKATANPT